MTIHQIRRLVSLHKKAEQHANEYRKLLTDPSARSKAFWHKRKSDQLYSQVSGLIRDFTSTPAGMAGNLPDSGFPARQN